MNQNSVKIKKISKGMLMFIRVLILAIVLYLGYSTIISITSNDSIGLTKEIMALLASSITVFLILGILIVVSLLLKSVEREYTPFNSNNVKKLKILSGLLIMFEPVHFISGKVVNMIHPVILKTGEKITTVVSFGGVIFALGLVVFCIALIFEYGIELQKQSDETL